MFLSKALDDRRHDVTLKTISSITFCYIYGSHIHGHDPQSIAGVLLIIWKEHTDNLPKLGTLVFPGQAARDKRQDMLSLQLESIRFYSMIMIQCDYLAL